MWRGILAVVTMAAICLVVLGAAWLLLPMIDQMMRMMQPIDYVVLIGSTCAGLLLVAELYALYRRGWAVRRSSAILVLTALLISAALGVAFMVSLRDISEVLEQIDILEPGMLTRE